MCSTGCEWGGCSQPGAFKAAAGELSMDDVTSCGTGSSSSCLDDLSPASTCLEDLSPASSGRSDDSKATRRPVIVFDWDDTLFCSTAAAQLQWTRAEVDELEDTVRSVLHTAMSVGDTLIVTNGVSNWVQDSARRFMPGLLPTIARLHVISARALFEKSYPGDPYMWKQAAFEQLFLGDRQIYEEGLNLVALGDQRPEIDAAQSIVRSLGGLSRVKTVKFKEAPSVRDLIGQLLRVQSELINITQSQDNCELCLQSQMPNVLELGSTKAEFWRIVVAEEEVQGIWPFSRFPVLATIKDVVSMFS